MFCLFCVVFCQFLVDSSYDSGDYENAKKYSNIAKWLNIVSAICGVIVIVVVIIVVSAGGSSSSSSSSY